MNALDFVGAFERLTRVYDHARKLALGGSDLSAEQLSILSEAARHPGTPVGTLASALSMTAAAARKAVRALVTKGLLVDDDDTVEPTERGQQVSAKATAEVWAGFASVLGGAGAIANAFAVFITSLTNILDRWRERNLPPPDPAPPKKSGGKSRLRKRPAR